MPNIPGSTASTLVALTENKFRYWSHTIGLSLEAAIIPRRCASCRCILTQQEADWCGPCAFSWTRCPTNPRLRFDSPIQWSHGWSWLQNSPTRLEAKLIHELKYGVRSTLGLHLGQAMAKESPSHHLHVKGWAIIPIPLHRKKLRSRGFNQSKLLAKGWCQVHQMKLVDALTRPTSGRSLTRFGRSQRFLRTRQLYTPNPSLSPDWSKNTIGCLLIDDVVTTGATLDAAKNALRQIWEGPIGFVTCLDAAH